MNKNHIFLSIALVICLTLFLSGCAGKNVATSNTGNTDTEPTVTTDTEDNNPEGSADVVPEDVDMADETIMTIEIPEDTPVADQDGEIPGADGVSQVVRDTVTFGRFYQDSEGKELTPVEWIVLDEQDGYTLLMTKPIIASRGWVNQGRDDITWAETDLRGWLNNEFFSTAFSEEEKENVALFRATQPQNPRYDTPAGEETIDNVSLLSYQELIKYMPTDLERKTRPTDYAVQQGCYLNTDGDSAWWLRSPGPTATVPEHLASWGNLGARTHYIDDESIGVRPVIWVKSDYLASVSETAAGLQISVDYQRSTERATNQVALWVEDSSETLVKTIFVTDFVGSRRGYTRREMALSQWQLAATPETMTDEELDAVSGATPQSGKLKFVWDLTDSNGDPVPDGRYRIFLEGNMYWESEILYTIEFDLEQGQVRNITTNVERSQPDEHTNEEMLTNLEVSVLNG